MSSDPTRGRGQAAGIDSLDRVCVKIPVAEGSIEDEAEVFVPIFHEWIRANELDLVTLDVADYAHVPDGPGIMLICHEVNFALDRSDGAFGLLAQRRVPFEGSAVDAVAETIRQVLDVAGRLERHERVGGRLRFDATRLRIESNDRLRAPNTDPGYRAFAPVVEAAADRVFRDAALTLVRVDNDPRDRLAVEVAVDVDSGAREHVGALTATRASGSV